MLRMSRLTDYGVVLLGCFAAEPPGSVHASRELAAATGLPPATVRKLLKQLQRAGLLASQRGLHGGYVLARPAAAITLAAVVRALEGPIALAECQAAERSGCRLDGACPVRATWRAIGRTMTDALDHVTLAAVARPGPRLRAHRAAPRAGRRAVAGGEVKSS
jgi:FeS assembly SUF system regulator